MAPAARPPDGRFAVNVAAALLLGAYALYLLVQGPSGRWLVNQEGGLNQTDFAEFWGAGRLAAFGHGAFAYTWTKMGPLLGPAAAPLATTPYPFVYPPPMLLFLRPLSLFAPALAATLWVSGGLGVFLLCAWSILPRASALLSAAASPALFCCLYMGQNGLFTGACLACALTLLDRRPLLAGVLIGLLSCKPQLGILIPFALAAGGRWRTAGAAAATVAALAALSLSVFGWSAWEGFLDASLQDQRLCELMVPRSQSPYAFLRGCGASIKAAWAGQAAAALACLGFVIAHWRSRQATALKSAGLIAATVLATPYSFFYDFPVVTLGVLFVLAAPRSRPLGVLDAAALVLIFALPILVLCVDGLVFKRVSLQSVGPALCLLLLLVVVRRWFSDAGRLAPRAAGEPEPQGRGSGELAGAPAA